MKRIAMVLMLLATGTGMQCQNMTVPLPVDHTGDWLLTWSDGGQTCFRVENERVTTVFGGCATELKVTFAPQIAMSGDMLLISFTSESVNQREAWFAIRASQQDDTTYLAEFTFKLGDMSQEFTGILRKIQ